MIFMIKKIYMICNPGYPDNPINRGSELIFFHYTFIHSTYLHGLFLFNLNADFFFTHG